MATPLILIVDNNRSDLEQLTRQLDEEGYEILGASSLEEVDNAIGGEKTIKLALVYLAGFNDSIWERCDRMHEARIPFIVVMPQRSPSIQRDSLKHKASCLLVQPLGINELIEHIHAALGD